MSVHPAAGPAPARNPHRFRLRRAGVLNVWQYDEQVFDIDGGRLLLRGTNGAGKSKTLEMLLPFALDGDKLRMTASGRHHTSLSWLMLDGYDAGTTRTGYVWVEFERQREDGEVEHLTCGVGIRASASGRTVGTWHFVTDRRVGLDLQLEDDAGPLTQPRLQAEIGTAAVFAAKEYREHVGRVLFGLDPVRYEELLRLLYWLRQPQVGEDIDPTRLAAQLVQALPTVDESAIRSAGDTFDQLQAFGEEIGRRERTTAAVRAFAEVYGRYARGVLAGLAGSVREAHATRRRRTGEARRLLAEVQRLTSHRDGLERGRQTAGEELRSVRGRLEALRTGPEARSERELLARSDKVGALAAELGRARAVAQTARRRATSLRSESASELEDLGRQLGTEQRGWDDTAVRMRRSGWERGHDLPASAVPRARVDVEESARVLAQVPDLVRAEDRVGAGLLAAVDAVEDARRAHATASTRAGTEEERAAVTAALRDQALSDREATQLAARTAQEDLVTALAAWARAAPEDAVEPPLPDQDEVPRLPRLAAALAQPAIVRWSADVAGREAVLRSVRDAIAELDERRLLVERERDPRPPPPAVHRDARADVPGAPLWRLVDFSADLPATDRAGLEAALEGAGLLDAWVRPDGAVLDDRMDVVLAARVDLPGGPDGPGGPEPDPERALGWVLRPDDPPPGCGVGREVVLAVLGRVALRTAASARDQSDREDLAVRRTLEVSVDGRWWTGDLTGRTRKAVAQYIGTGAREAERERRLEEIDRERASLAAQVLRAEADLAQARTRLEAWHTWVADVPDGTVLLRAWRDLELASTLLTRAVAADELAQGAARSARSRAAELLAALEHLGSVHGLPVDDDGLRARRTQVQDVSARLAEHRRAAVALVAALTRWLVGDQRATQEEQEADLRDGELAHASTEHQHEARRLEELSAAVGEGVAELRRRIEGLVADERRFDAELGAAGRAFEQALRDVARVEAEHAGAEERAVESFEPLRDAGRRLADVVRLDGLLAASAVPVPDEQVQALRTLEEVLSGPDGGLSRAAAAAVDALTAAAAPTADVSGLMSAWRDLESGPGASAHPRLVELSGAYLVTGRDEGGEHPVTTLAPRLERALSADRELLSEKERRLFEEHVLGDLGHVLRERRREADELVRAMNDQLDGVSTSQGIRVRLRWRLRDDVPADVRRAVELLGERVDGLLPDERQDLRSALHRLIEASRAESPEDSYTEHLARALDYRQWHEFRIRYLRPEGGGTWMDLRRRSPLSQGEQKVVCYLPLFAAAAAHFTSLAGAAPHAPRIVLLDDAFPKIDARTHPKLFGLLVDLDLDFVVTSERLWGDHETVPSLAIYEALRDPGQRGIAQFHHRWDGRRLHSVGG